MSYFVEALGGPSRTEIIADSVDAIGPLRPSFIAVRGISGAVIGNCVAEQLQIPLVVVRKRGDNSHSGELVTGIFRCESELSTYCIVDDFVASGATAREIVSALCSKYSCLGLWTYKESTAQHVEMITNCPIILGNRRYDLRAKRAAEEKKRRQENFTP